MDGRRRVWHICLDRTSKNGNSGFPLPPLPLNFVLNVRQQNNNNNNNNQATADSSCLVIRIPRDLLLNVLQSEPNLRENLMRQFRRLKEKRAVKEMD